MNRKIFIALFLTIFYNGVICASTKETVSQLTSSEKHPVSVSGTNGAVKVESVTSVPESRTQSKETSALNNSTSTATVSHSKIIPSTVLTKTPNVIESTHAPVAATNAVVIVPNISNKTGTPPNNSEMAPVATTNAATNAAVIVPNISNKTGTSPNNSEMPRPIPNEQSTISVTTVSSGTTAKAPVTEPAVVTSTPCVHTVIDSVTIEHGSASEVQGSHFDGANFVGGIVLTVGLTAIGFIAYKYYKSGKINANYRTL